MATKAASMRILYTAFALAGITLLLSAASARAASLIPDSRRIDWTQVGVPGGVPSRTTIFSTINAAAYGNGTTDASGVINTAIANCPANQVVYLPAGTYRLNSRINLGFKNGVTLRGAGPGKTVLKPADGLGTAIATDQTGFSSERRILGGSTKGSRSITVDNTAGIAPGLMLNIYQADDPSFYWSRSGTSGHTGQFVMVTAVSGTTVQFEDPLVWDFTLNPRFRYQPMQGARFCGVEDLTISAGSSYDGSMIQFWFAYACWARNVETAWGNGNEHIFLTYSLRCEIRDSYIHDTFSTTDGYGIVTLFGHDGYHGGCTGTLVENNIFSGLWCAIIFETEVGSVFAYNYSRAMRLVAWPNYQVPDFNGNHGAHGLMYLLEGNAGSGGFQQDGYHGSVSHATVFRNHFSGQHVEAHRTGNIKLIDLGRFSRYHNVVGNVLGSPSWPRTTTGRYEMTGTPGYTEQAVIYRLGYPNMGNNYYSPTNPPTNADDGGLDTVTKTTLLRWGNFDYQNNATRWEASEVPSGVAVPADHVLPISLYQAAKPSWFRSVPWPPIGPDVAGLTNKIPAQLRYEAMTNPTVPVITTQPQAKTVTVGQSATFSVAATGTAPLTYQWQKNGSNISGATSASYTTPATTSADNGSTFRVIVSNSAGSATSNTVTLTVTSVPNQPPVIQSSPVANPNPVTLPATTTVSIVASDPDSGLQPLTYTWSKVSGPGTVTFSPNGTTGSALSTATFSAAGSYVVLVTVSDGAANDTDTVAITVNPAPPVNAAPVVDAGPNRTVTMPSAASLDGTVSDDGLPNPPAKVTVTWTKVSGPGTVSFANATSVDTTATFSAAGSYVLRMTASDSALSNNDTMTVTVNAAPPPPPTVIVDNKDANTSRTGTWSVSASLSPYATDSLYSNSGGTFRWLPALPAAGTYEVYAWWTYHSNRSSSVPHSVATANGVVTVNVNQHDSTLGGKWNKLGTFSFNASGAYVEVASANGQACADAVKFVKSSSAPPPPPVDVIVDNTNANTSKTGTWATSAGLQPYAGQSLYSNSGGTFRWAPALPQAGSYKVYAWWTYHKNRSTSVPYRIAHSTGVATVTVNQNDEALGGQWNLLGTFDLGASGAYVEVSSENGQACADAVRIVGAGSSVSTSSSRGDEEGPEIAGLDVSKLSLKRLFSKSGKDACKLRAVLPLGEDFETDGQSVAIGVGGLAIEMTFDAKGKARGANGTCTLKLKKGSWILTANLKNLDAAAAWGEELLVEAPIHKEARGITVSVELDGVLYVAEHEVSYSAKPGKTGIAK